MKIRHRKDGIQSTHFIIDTQYNDRIRYNFECQEVNSSNICPGVSFTLCCSVVPTWRFVLCLTLCYLFLCFSVLLAWRLPRLGKRELILVLFRTFVRFARVSFLSISSSSWCLGRAAVCDCGTPWTFLLPFWIRLNHLNEAILTNIHNKCSMRK